MADRTVILHYHLFKNAGTSLDRILQKNFPDAWETEEFPAMGGNNSDLVAEWIKRNPDVVAFSSHTANGPVPRVPGVNVVSILFLRDPIARIRSAYHFEKSQKAETWGANLARSTDLAGYVRTRLSTPHDRQCRDFHVARLATLVPGPKEREFERAVEGLCKLSVVGFVESFDESIGRLKAALGGSYPEFTWEPVHANASNPDAEIGADLRAELEAANAADYRLIELCRRSVGA
ncbi:sulfotransferase family 2 domain-containing protein [Histidinibacterium lentulum]|nr:sulfotransferase family 2 domain-containing protein [Histidinibacterium lentulum]